MDNNKVLAVVNGKEITELSVLKFMRSLSQANAQQFNVADGKKRVIEELIHQELLYADAIDNRYDEDEEFLTKLDETEEEMLKQYAWFKIISNIQIPDEELEKYYKENKPDFFRDLTLRASHILVDTEEKAEEVLKEINDGADFGDVAKKYSSCPSKDSGGDLGFFTKGKMVKEFDDAVFNMSVGEISKAIKTQFGYHVIKLTEQKAAGILPFDEIKESLKKELLKAKQTFFLTKKLEDLSKIYTIEIKEDL